MKSLRLVKLAGQVVGGRYQVQHLIGAGGMGSVWKVRHLESLQDFALKTLHSEHAQDRRRLVRFLREVRAAARLNTRHVARVVDAQMSYEHDGAPLPYFVMEHLRGETLASLCARRVLTPSEVVWVTDQIVRALRLAHASGIVHRDLKPSNVFVALAEDDEPVVKLCDFGVAKLVTTADPGTHATRTGDVFGTPLYMAPEQLRGTSDQTAAVDQWALGTIVFRMLSGKDYFEGVSSYADLVAEVLAPALEPASRRGAVPPGFDAWFARSCAREAKDRWRDVEEQRSALVALLGSPAPSVIVPEQNEMDVAPPSNLLLSSTAQVGAAAVDLSATAASRRAARGIVLYTLGVLVAIVGVAFGIGKSLVEPPVGAAGMAGSELTVPSPAPIAPLAQAASPARSETPSAPAASVSPGSPAPKREAPHAPKNQKKPSGTSAPTPAVAPAPSRPSLSKSGAACGRSAECESGLCLARVCQ